MKDIPRFSPDRLPISDATLRIPVYERTGKWHEQTRTSHAATSLTRPLVNVICALVIAFGVWQLWINRSHTLSVSSPVCGTWHVPGSLETNFGLSSIHLNSVSALSKDDVWFAGSDGKGQPLFMHWNGRGFARISAPSLVNRGGISSLTASASNNVWAVGGTSDATNTRPLTMHWNGREWSIVPTPRIVVTEIGEVLPLSASSSPKIDAVEQIAYLTSVAVISTEDAWAAGFYSDDDYSRYGLLVLHWNGIEWKVVASAQQSSPGITSSNSIVALSENDVWAFSSESSKVDYHPLALHWDGKEWGRVELPLGLGDIDSAAASPSKDLWIMGGYKGWMRWKSAVKRQDSSSWELFPGPGASTSGFPSPGVCTSGFPSITVPSSDDVWAVSRAPGQRSGFLAVHWNGKDWEEIPGPNFADEYSLKSVSAAAKDDIWVVGYASIKVGWTSWLDDDARSRSAVIAHFVGCSASGDR